MFEYEKAHKSLKIFEWHLLLALYGIKSAFLANERFIFEAALLLSHVAEILLRNQSSLKTILKVFTLADKNLAKKNNNSGKTNRA